MSCQDLPCDFLRWQGTGARNRQTMAMNGNEDLARRVRAARALAGFESVEALADAIGQRGLSARTLRNIEQGRRHAEPRELAAIAEACDLTPQFFRLDFSAPLSAHENDTRLENVETQIASLWENVTQQRGELDGVRAQVEQLTQEALGQRERQAAERESKRRDTKRGKPDAQSDR